MTNPTPNPNPQPMDADAAQQARLIRLKANSGMDVEYAKADEELRTRMDEIIAPIEAAPDDYLLISSFGQEPLTALSGVAGQVLEAQQRFEKQLRVIDEKMNFLQKGIRDMDFGSIKKMVTGMAKKSAKGAGGVASGVGRFFGMGKNKDEDQKEIEEMQDQLPQMMETMEQLIEDVEKTGVGIEQVVTEVRKLGQARIECARELAVYIGAGKEIVRRYKDVYIPEVEKELELDPSNEALVAYRDELVSRQEDIAHQVTVLRGSHAQSHVAANQLKIILDTMREQDKKVKEIQNISQNDWKAMLAEAGIAASALKSAKMMEKTGEFADKMFDTAQGMIEKSHDITRQSRSRGTLDPDKLIKAMENMGKILEQAETDRVNRIKTLEANDDKLREATAKLLETAQKTESSRRAALEGASTKKATGKPIGKPAAANDDATAPEAAPAPRQADNPPTP